MSKRKRDYSSEWARRPYHQKISHWNKSSDKKFGRDNNIDSKMTKQIIEKECFYCEIKPANGIDRMDSSIGHILGNCVPSCSKCNMILGDLPFSIKQLMAPGLKEARKLGLLESYDPPPFRVTTEE